MRTVTLVEAPTSAGAYAPGQEDGPRALLEAGLVERLEAAGVAGRRAAISGTTPPNRACSSVCERTILDKIRPDPSLRRSTTAAAVSSQVVSIPRTRVRTSIGVSLP